MRARGRKERVELHAKKAPLRHDGAFLLHDVAEIALDVGVFHDDRLPEEGAVLRASYGKDVCGGTSIRKRDIAVFRGEAYGKARSIYEEQKIFAGCVCAKSVEFAR